MSKLDRGISRITSEVGEFSGYFIPNIVTAIVAIIIVIQIKSEFVVLMLAGFVPFLIINTIALRKYEPIEKKWNKLYDYEYGHFWEVISSIRLVKSFNRVGYELKRLDKFNKKSEDLNKKSETIWDFSSIKDLFLDTWTWGINIYVISLVLNGEITLGTFFLLIQYSAILREPLWALSWLYFEIKRMHIGARDYLNIINSKPAIISKSNAVDVEKVKGEIYFDNVTFEYKKNQPVIKNMTFKIADGETIALVGKSGSGKTTITNLITRFYDVTNGSIKIDGLDIRQMTLTSLFENVGMVMQESYLFDDTIKANLLYGNPKATDEQIITACKMANAWEFIQNLKNGLKTEIGERGIKLSGGQKQRLSIARTILKDPPILIFDEATSSLDSESEKKVQDAIGDLMKGRTTIIVAHRLSTVQKANRIFVLGDRKIQEEGSHAELVKQDGIYAALYKMQTRMGDDTLLEEYELT
jgi:ABC-type multidrug transport system fused ATPase/permease subunit